MPRPDRCVTGPAGPEGFPAHAAPPHDALEVPELLRVPVETHRDEAERRRRLPDALVEALRTTAATRLWTPRELGGFEASLPTGLRVLDGIARLDGPTAWVAYNTNLGLFAALLDPRAVAEVWARPDPVVVNSTRPGGHVRAVEGGYVVSGRWRPVSGAAAADWACLFAVVDDAVRVLVVPRHDLAVDHTWDADGLRGSGSDTVRLEDAFVPAHRVHDPVTPTRLDRPLYRTPPFSVLSSGAAAVVLGLADAVLDELRVVLGARTAGAEEVHHAAGVLGRLDAELRASRLLLLACAGDLEADAVARRPPSVLARSRIRGAMSHAARTAREVATASYELAGSAVLHHDHRLPRLVRDVRVAAQHVNLSPVHFGLAGRSLLGHTDLTGIF